MRLSSIRTLVAVLCFLGVAMLAVHYRVGEVSAQAPARFTGPTNSQPIALSADDWTLAVANPDNNSVSIFDVRAGANTRVAQVGVGVEPNGVAVSPDGTRVYVANTVSGTVSVLRVDRATSTYGANVAEIRVGTEPYALALTPSGRKLYVANARSHSVSVIDTASNLVTKTIADVGIEPRGIAITNSGGDDSAETVFVTSFLALPVAGKLDGADDAKVGRVTAIRVSDDTIFGGVTLNPLADTGFRAAGDALARVAPPAAPVADDFRFPTGAYPNQLNGIAIRGRFAFVPSTGASPNGPVRFNVNTQSLLSVFDTATRADVGSINMHVAVARQTNTTRRFITQPWNIAFKKAADEGYVISSASDIVVKVKVDPATGAPTVQSDPTDATRVLQIPTGKNPRGIIVNSNDRTAYVMNYVSRDVTVIDLSGTVERVSATLSSASVPAAGTPADRAHIGKELYYSSGGEFDPPASGQPAIRDRLSDNGWGSCGSCHPFGLTDNVVWIFAAGPRRTVPQHVDFAPGEPTTPRALNWSAIFDEEEDFEANIRNVSGGRGLIVGADGVTPDPTLAAFTPANGARRQLTVRGVGAWDALKAYIATGIRSPISPVLRTEPDAVAGRQLFIDSNCQVCHGGPQWSTARVRFTSPPDGTLVSGAQLITELRNVGTFNASVANEIRATAVAPLGAAGFSPAPLLSLHAFPQTFLHNGGVDSLDAVLQNVTHRSAGTGTDRLQDAAQRRQLVRFLLSIDGATPPIDPPAPGALRNVLAASGGAVIAPDSFVSGFGAGLAGTTVGSDAPPVVLGGSTVSIRDGAGVLRLAALSFVSPGQINYIVPASAASGQATVTAYAAGTGATATGTVAVARVAPGLFAANGGGTGVAAATAIRVNADNSQSPVSVFACAASSPCAPDLIDLSRGPVFLTLYGTGIRGRTTLENVRVTVGGTNAPVLFAGAQGSFPALDQVNVQVPDGLRGRGEVQVVLIVDGQTANTVTIGVQ